jgi:hypothetical protein
MYVLFNGFVGRSNYNVDWDIEVGCIRESNGCTVTEGRAVAQAVSRRPLAAEARIRSRISPCGICGGQSGTGTGLSPSTSVFPCQFHSTCAPLHGKRKKLIILIIFITWLNSKPQWCGASVASAAAPFTKKKLLLNDREKWAAYLR